MDTNHGQEYLVTSCSTLLFGAMPHNAPGI
jgi:hypothetical protein